MAKNRRTNSLVVETTDSHKMDKGRIEFYESKLREVSLENLMWYLSMTQENKVPGMITWNSLELCFSENEGPVNRQIYRQLLEGVIDHDKEQFYLQQNSLKNHIGNINTTLKQKKTKIFEFDEVNNMFADVQTKWAQYESNMEEVDMKTKIKQMEQRLLKYSESGSSLYNKDSNSHDDSESGDNSVMDELNGNDMDRDTVARPNKREQAKSASFGGLMSRSELKTGGLQGPWRSQMVKYGFGEIFEILSRKTKNPHKESKEPVSIGNLKDKKITCPKPFSFLARQSAKPETIRQRKLQTYILEREKYYSSIGRPLESESKANQRSFRVSKKKPKSSRAKRHENFRSAKCRKRRGQKATRKAQSRVRNSIAKRVNENDREPKSLSSRNLATQNCLSHYRKQQSEKPKSPKKKRKSSKRVM